jgi:hypothetical protein
MLRSAARRSQARTTWAVTTWAGDRSSPVVWQKDRQRFYQSKQPCVGQSRIAKDHNRRAGGPGIRGMRIPETYRGFFCVASSTRGWAPRRIVSQQQVKCLSVRPGDHGYAFAQAAKQALLAVESTVRAHIEITVRDWLELGDLRLARAHLQTRKKWFQPSQGGRNCEG